MNMNALAGNTVLVLGLGESGLAMARWCARAGAAVRVWDTRLVAAAGGIDSTALPNAATLLAEHPAVQLLAGELSEAALDGVSLLLKSPGLAPTDSRKAPT